MIDPKLVEAARAAFPAAGKTVTLGAPIHGRRVCRSRSCPCRSRC